MKNKSEKAIFVIGFTFVVIISAKFLIEVFKNNVYIY
tara:strand:+ start:224 stop:334 length:111 start_codon:yes stop_codon:yes gene_type:complete